MAEIEGVRMKEAARREREARTCRDGRELDSRLSREDNAQETLLRIEDRDSRWRVAREAVALLVSFLLIVVGIFAFPHLVGIGAILSGVAGGATTIGIVYRGDRPGPRPKLPERSDEP